MDSRSTNPSSIATIHPSLHIRTVPLIPRQYLLPRQSFLPPIHIRTSAANPSPSSPSLSPLPPNHTPIPLTVMNCITRHHFTHGTHPSHTPHTPSLLPFTHNQSHSLSSILLNRQDNVHLSNRQLDNIQQAASSKQARTDSICNTHFQEKASRTHPHISHFSH